MSIKLGRNYNVLDRKNIKSKHAIYPWKGAKYAQEMTLVQFLAKVLANFNKTEVYIPSRGFVI